ncbi:hypothetical protein LWI29_016839 [Acer saccharum]|uniref:Glycosyl hydrolase family 32 N-terminal domain-containing protein n=1 Tax=Acer saccharum TaxID=4024 RepID=A0AA39SEM8_ACESA|nr:hypothetical protein LWI29_016839 [Acer saccharum]
MSTRGKSVKYVLKNSLEETKHDYYTIGTYDVVKDKYFPDKGMVEGDAGLRYDYGKFYASKTFFDDEKKRRILWGLTNESSSVKDDVLKGWFGIQADVEVSFQVSDLKNVEVIKKKHYNPKLLCSKNSASVRGGLGPFGFLTFASNCLREYTSVFFRIYNHRNKHIVLICSDQSRSFLKKHNDNTTYGAFVDLDPAQEKLTEELGEFLVYICIKL